MRAEAARGYWVFMGGVKKAPQGGGVGKISEIGGGSKISEEK